MSTIQIERAYIVLHKMDIKLVWSTVIYGCSEISDLIDDPRVFVPKHPFREIPNVKSKCFRSCTFVDIQLQLPLNLLMETWVF